MPPADDMLYMIFTAGFAFGIGIQAAKLFVENWEYLFAFWVILPVKILLACTKKIFSFINLNMEKAMKTYLILAVIGAVIGALVGAIAGWLVSLVWPCVIVGTVAGAIGLPTFRIWPNWFSDRVPDWVPGAVMLVVCVMLGGVIGAFTGWDVRGCGFGALFGCIVVGMSYGIRHLPLNVQ